MNSFADITNAARAGNARPIAAAVWATVGRRLAATAAGLLLFAVAASMPANGAAPRTDPGGVKREAKNAWFRTGPLGDTPQRVTDEWPLADQENRGGWKPFAPMTDEFAGSELDATRWTPSSPTFKGRPPGLFRESNVAVRDGQLQLTMRREPVPREFQAKGYRDYTSAIVRSTTDVVYGYFEVQARPMNSAGSSSFWFAGRAEGWRTEIDVFEIGGRADGFAQKYNMHLHVFYTPDDPTHWKLGQAWIAPRPLVEDTRVYGLLWDRDEIRFDVDGVPVWRVENTHWHHPLYMIFDSETMGDWFGMPEDKDLPSTYTIDYVRAWKR